MRVGKFALGLRAQSTCPEACRWAASAEVGTVLASVVGGGRVNAGCSFSGISAHLLLSYVHNQSCSASHFPLGHLVPLTIVFDQMAHPQISQHLTPMIFVKCSHE